MGQTGRVTDAGTPSSQGEPLPGWGQSEYVDWMRSALEAARGATASSDVPVGAVVVDARGVELGRGHNMREASADPAGHAEIVALRAAGAALGGWRLSGCSLVVTLEPCAMCAGAAVLARVDRVVFGAFDPKAGACGSVWDLLRDRHTLHRPEVVAGVLESACVAGLGDFFATRRLG